MSAGISDFSLERGLPAAVDVERYLLGTLLWSPELIYEASAKLRSEDFFLDSHRVIFTALRSLHDAGVPIEEITLVERLREQGKLDSVGGWAYVTEMVSSGMKSTTIAHKIDTLRKKANLRTIIHLSNAAMGAAMASDADPG